MPLPEYANFYTRRDVVEGAVKWLENLESIYGLADPARSLLGELRAGLERSRHREALARIQAVVGPLEGDALEALADRLEELASKLRDPEELPSGWEMILPGYAVDNGQDKRERRVEHYARYCDARGGQVQVSSDDDRGVPTAVVKACIDAAASYPEEFAL